MQSRLSRNEKTSQQALAQAATHAEALLVEVVLFFLGGGRPYGICFLAVFFGIRNWQARHLETMISGLPTRVEENFHFKVLRISVVICSAFQYEVGVWMPDPVVPLLMAHKLVDGFGPTFLLGLTFAIICPRWRIEDQISFQNLRRQVKEMSKTLAAASLSAAGPGESCGPHAVTCGNWMYTDSVMQSLCHLCSHAYM